MSFGLLRIRNHWLIAVAALVATSSGCQGGDDTGAGDDAVVGRCNDDFVKVEGGKASLVKSQLRCPLVLSTTLVLRPIT